MHNSELPRRTAGNVTLPGGETVWVCTLNSLLFNEVDVEARWFAESRARRYLRGQGEYQNVREYGRSMGAEARATFNAQLEYVTIWREAQERFPEPERPEQREAEPAEFSERVVAWERARDDAQSQRDAYVAERHAAEVARNLALSKEESLDRFCATFHASEWGKAFTRRREVETIYRATRRSEKHSAYYFESPQDVMDADDDAYAALREFYYATLEVPSAEDVPTSPAAS